MKLTGKAAFGIAGVITMVTTPLIETAVHIAPRGVLGVALDLATWLALAVGLFLLGGRT